MTTPRLHGCLATSPPNETQDTSVAGGALTCGARVGGQWPVFPFLPLVAPWPRTGIPAALKTFPAGLEVSINGLLVSTEARIGDSVQNCANVVSFLSYRGGVLRLVIFHVIDAHTEAPP